MDIQRGCATAEVGQNYPLTVGVNPRDSQPNTSYHIILSAVIADIRVGQEGLARLIHYR